MCQVHLVKAMGQNLSLQEIEAFTTLMTRGGLYNPDAWGYSCKKGVYKEKGSPYEYEKETLKKKIKNFMGKDRGTYLIGHNRLTTHGSEDKNHNNHPFETTDLVMVHNGIINNHEELKNNKRLFYKAETDSYLIVQAIQNLIDGGSHVVNAIKVVAELLTGSYSVLLLDKRTENIYYFKNKSTSFSFALIGIGSKKILVGSTDIENLHNIYVEKEMIFSKEKYDTYLETVAKPEIIYKIDNDGVKEVLGFKQKITPVVHYGTTTINKDYNNYYNQGITHKGYNSNYEYEDDYDLQSIMDKIEQMFYNVGVEVIIVPDYYSEELKISMVDNNMNDRVFLNDYLYSYATYKNDTWIMKEQDAVKFLQDETLINNLRGEEEEIEGKALKQLFGGN